jgi:hypothetical protein
MGKKEKNPWRCFSGGGMKPSEGKNNQSKRNTKWTSPPASYSIQGYRAGGSTKVGMAAGSSKAWYGGDDDASRHS